MFHHSELLGSRPGCVFPRVVEVCDYNIKVDRINRINRISKINNEVNRVKKINNKSDRINKINAR